MFCFARSEMKKKIAAGAGFISCELHHACMGQMHYLQDLLTIMQMSGQDILFFNTDGHCKQTDSTLKAD